MFAKEYSPMISISYILEQTFSRTKLIQSRIRSKITIEYLHVPFMR